jgi:uncharacterized protein with GYD domain
MPAFIMAMSINPNAKRQHSNLSTQINESLNCFKAPGVKLLKIYATMGRYDCLAVFESEEQATAFRVATTINHKGILETETWPVIPFEDFSSLVG